MTVTVTNTGTETVTVSSAEAPRPSWWPVEDLELIAEAPERDWLPIFLDVLAIGGWVVVGIVAVLSR